MLSMELLALPIVCLVVWGTLSVRRRWAALALSIGMCAATLGAGAWSIRQSRSSTAAIGFLFLPALAALSALPAAAFAAWRVSTRPALRAVAWVALTASLIVPGAAVFDGFQARAKNARADRAYAEQERVIAANRVRIRAMLDAHPGAEETALSAEIAAHRGDRTVLIPALETPFVPEQILDALGHDSDLGVVLMVARNPRTPPETLERIYRGATYPPYFFQALAANPRTPVPVLRELARHRHENSGIAPALARNPSTPPDVLNAIASFTRQAPPFAVSGFRRDMDLSTLLDRYPASSHELTPGRGVRPRTSREDERAWIREFFRTRGSGQYLIRVNAAESQDHIYAVQADVREGVTERLWLSFEQPLEMVRPADRGRSNDVRHPACAPILAALTKEYGRPAASPPRSEEALEWFDYEWTRSSETMTLECGRYRGRAVTFASAVTMTRTSVQRDR